MAWITAASEASGSVRYAVYSSRGEVATLCFGLSLPQVYSRHKKEYKIPYFNTLVAIGSYAAHKSFTEQTTCVYILAHSLYTSTSCVPSETYFMLKLMVNLDSSGPNT